MNVARRKFFETPQTMARKKRAHHLTEILESGVEQSQHAVNEREILGYRQCWREAHKQRLREENQRRQCKASERPDNCNQEFRRLGARGFHLQSGIRHQKMNRVIRPYGNLVADGHPRMGQFRAQTMLAKKTKLLSQHPINQLLGACATFEFSPDSS